MLGSGDGLLILSVWVGGVIATDSREWCDQGGDRLQERPWRACRSDLRAEGGHHDGELEEARHSLLIELVVAGEREVGLEEGGGVQRWAERPDPVRLLLSRDPEVVRDPGWDRDRLPGANVAFLPADAEANGARQNPTAALLVGMGVLLLAGT